MRLSAIRQVGRATSARRASGVSARRLTTTAKTTAAAGMHRSDPRLVEQVVSTDPPSIPEIQHRGPKRSPSPPKLADLKIGFVGWGAMAQAVSLGVIRAGLNRPSQVFTFDVVDAMKAEAEKHGLQTCENIKSLVEQVDIVVIAVKPQSVDAVMPEVARGWSEDKVLVSICAGVTIDTYSRHLSRAADRRPKVVRVMPNTPCLVAAAASAYATSDFVLDWETELVHGIFSAVGSVHRVPEYLLNTVTGLSGSGPAYVYTMIQALSDAGVYGGLPRQVATNLAAQTVLGSAKMVLQTQQHPMVLREAVTSPAGTTIAGVRQLEKSGFNSAVIEAVECARKRSEELSQTPDFLHTPLVEKSTDNPI